MTTRSGGATGSVPHFMGTRPNAQLMPLIRHAVGVTPGNASH
jgi:hypothetical protein